MIKDDSNTHDTGLALAALKTAMAERPVADKILLCNETTRKYGLTLTEQQALALAQTRTTALKDTKRLEFGGGIVDKLIMALCDSPYVTQESYEDTLHEWILLFYELKNNTWDQISDQALINFFKTAYNGCCRGSTELLKEKAQRLAGHIHCGKRIDTFRLEEE